jgi:hypothetical protein
LSRTESIGPDSSGPGEERLVVLAGFCARINGNVASPVSRDRLAKSNVVLTNLLCLSPGCVWRGAWNQARRPLSEIEPGAELDSARTSAESVQLAALQAGYTARRTAADVQIRVSEVRMIEEVCGCHTELKPRPLGDAEVFEQAEVDVIEAATIALAMTAPVASVTVPLIEP